MKRVLLSTCGIAGVIAMSTAVLAQQPRTGGAAAPDQQRPVQDVVLQGCVATADSAGQGRSGGAGANATKGAPGAAAADAFLLTQATRGGVSSGENAGGAAAKTDPSERPVQGTTPSGRQSAYQQSTQQPDAGADGTATYRLVTTGSDVNLREHVGHLVEVRGRVADVTGTDMHAGQHTPGRTGAAEGTQHGQGGQRTTTPANTQAGQPADDEGAAGGKAVTAVMVTSVKMIAASCGTR